MELPVSGSNATAVTMAAPTMAVAARGPARSASQATAATTAPIATPTEAGAAMRTTVNAHGRRTRGAVSKRPRKPQSALTTARGRFRAGAERICAAAPTLHGITSHNNRINHSVGCDCNASRTA